MALNVALVISGDATGAKAAAAETTAAVKVLGSEALAAGQQMVAASDQAALAARRATDALTAETAAQTRVQQIIAGSGGVEGPTDDASYRQRAAEAYGAELDRLRARFNPLFAAEQQHLALLREIDDAARIAAISEGERQAAIARATAGYQRQVVLLGQTGRAAGLTANQLLNLSRQGNDVVTMFALGASPMQIFASQAGQIVDALQSGPGGLSGSLRAIGGELLSLIGRFPVVTGAIAAAGAAWVAYELLVEDSKSVDDVLAEHKRMIDDIAAAYPKAAAAAKAYEDQAATLPKSVVDADSAVQARQERAKLQSALDAIRAQIKVATTEPFSGQPVVDPNLGTEAFTALREIEEGLENGTTSAKELEKRIGDLRVDPALPTAAHEFADSLQDAAIAAARAEGALQATGAMAERLTDEVAELDRLAKQFAISLQGISSANVQGELEGLFKASLDGSKSLADVHSALDRLERANPSFSGIIRGLEEIIDKAYASSDALTDAANRYAAAAGGSPNGRRYNPFADLPGGPNDARDVPMPEARPSREGEARPGAGLIQEQQDELARLRVEATLIGASRKERERAIAVYRADLDIRRQGIDVNSEEARTIRAGASAIADATVAVERHADAWRKAQQRIERYYSAVKRINDGYRPPLSDREQVEKDYRIAIGASTSREERDDAYRARQDALRRIVDQEDADAKPTPTPRPNLESEPRPGAELIQQQRDELARLQVEATLIGASRVERERAIAAYRADLDIRRQGIDVNSEEARTIRAGASAIADATVAVERHADAWRKAQQAGEDMIDSLLAGDWEGALKSLQKQLTDLLVGNPLKNALYGTDYPTADDYGGIAGWLGALVGRRPDRPAVDPVATSSTATQAVAGTVTRLLVGANDNGPPPVADAGPPPIALGAGTQGQIWNFFAQRGLQSHQIAGIMGNLGAESGYDHTARNPNGGAFGLPQWLGSRQSALVDFTGTRTPDVGQQLGFLWHELQGPERQVMRDLLAAPDVRSATRAFAGFERAEGWSRGNPEGIALWERRLSASQEALQRFTGTAAESTKSLGEFGYGAGELGKVLAGGGFPGAPSAPAGAVAGGFGGSGLSWLGNLFSAWGLSPAATMSIVNAGGGFTGLFEEGGPTGGSDPKRVAGVVHEGEYVMSAPAVRTIGIERLDALHKAGRTGRGFEDGGYAGGPAWPGGAGSAGGVRIERHYHTLPGMEVREERSDDGEGNIREDVTVDRALARAIGTPGSESGRALGGRFGARPTVRRR